MAFSFLTRKIKNNIFQQIRNGYIVLLPEVSAETSEKNALFKNELLNEELTPEKLVNTCGNNILEFEYSVREIENALVERHNDPDKGEVDVFESIVEPLESSAAPLETSWSLLKTIYFANNKLIPSETYLPIHERARASRCLKYNSYYIYRAFKECDVSKVPEEEQRVISKFLIEGKLNGLELKGVDKERFTGTSQSLAQECNMFKQKGEALRGVFKHTIRDDSVLKELPQSLTKAMGPDGATVTITDKVFPKILEYCRDRSLRQSCWKAAYYMNPNHPEIKISTNLEFIRHKRNELAKLLGYTNFADMSMETKMAGSVDNVTNTINLILEQAFPLQEKELDELQKFAGQQGFSKELEPWDVPYWANQHRKHLFKWDEEKLREYFPLEKVLAGLFELVHDAFGLTMVPAPDIKTWAPSATYYHVVDNGSIIASVILDLFEREGKLGGSQVVNIKPSSRHNSENPLSAVIFSLPTPTQDTPSLLTFSQVESLFMKFGVALQQILSNVHYTEVSGLSFIEWDAVEVVSNIMSLSLSSKKVLASVSGHYKTGEKLHLESIEPVRRHMVGYYLCHELFLAALDLQLYTSSDFWLPVNRNLWNETHVIPFDEEDCSLLFFTEAVCGPYAAAYFSKFWARMLATDAYFNAFNNPAAQIQTIGTRFRDTFLSFGGSCHPSEVFRRFQGRDPTPQAFINSLTDDTS